jgi:Uncharacterised nucleotidyltransferase
MAAKLSPVHRHLELLSRLVFQGYSPGSDKPSANLKAILADVQYLSALDETGLQEFLDTANKHHVLIRALQVVNHAASETGDTKIAAWSDSAVQTERDRIQHAIENLWPICNALEAAGCRVTVIKSLDHWPDLGSDLDLYTTGDERRVVEVISREFNAHSEERSWGDRLANKWNFSIPGLPELVEIHIRYLGQTGEHKALGRRVVQRSVTKALNGHTFRVPAPEERIIISTLQRMYRHFYFRLCDMADVARLLQENAIDFDELRRASLAGGIWPGVATFLLLVSEYVKSYGSEAKVPEQVLAAAYSPGIRVYASGDFLRVPKGPAAKLYGSQLLSAGRHRDLRAMFRLPLLPPLAVSALIAYRVTGSDKGIW